MTTKQRRALTPCNRFANGLDQSCDPPARQALAAPRTLISNRSSACSDIREDLRHRSKPDDLKPSPPLAAPPSIVCCRILDTSANSAHSRWYVLEMGTPAVPRPNRVQNHAKTIPAVLQIENAAATKSVRESREWPMRGTGRIASRSRDRPIFGSARVRGVAYGSPKAIP